MARNEGHARSPNCFLIVGAETPQNSAWPIWALATVAHTDRTLLPPSWALSNKSRNLWLLLLAPLSTPNYVSCILHSHLASPHLTPLASISARLVLLTTFFFLVFHLVSPSATDRPKK
jgi:hypothetical protein